MVIEDTSGTCRCAEALTLLGLIDGLEVVKNMVELGLGISFLPRSGVRQSLEDGTLVIIPLAEGQQVLLPTYVLVRKGQHYSPTVLAFLGLLHQIYNADIPILQM